MRNFRNYDIWKDSIVLSKQIYKICGNFPKHELFGLVSQMERAAVSISSNIAEGCGRDTEADFARFLDQALGSAYELETQLTIAKELGYITNEQYNEVVSQMPSLQSRIASLANKLRGKH